METSAKTAMNVNEIFMAIGTKKCLDAQMQINVTNAYLILFIYFSIV